MCPASAGRSFYGKQFSRPGKQRGFVQARFSPLFPAERGARSWARADVKRRNARHGGFDNGVGCAVFIQEISQFEGLTFWRLSYKIMSIRKNFLFNFFYLTAA